MSQGNLSVGILVLASAAVAFAKLTHLKLGGLAEPGPAMFPIVLVGVLAVLGVLLMFRTEPQTQAAVSRQSWRAAAVIVLSALVFASGIEGVSLGPVGHLPALGLPLAGALAMMVSGFADPNTRWPHLALLSCTLPVAFTVLLRFAVGQPILIAPWLMGY